jgi:hypothetical protein
MANENEKNPSALEELRRLKRTDRIKSLDQNYMILMLKTFSILMKSQKRKPSLENEVQKHM